MKPSLDQSTQYKRFITDRDLALEKIAQRYSSSQSIIMDHLISMTLDIVNAMASRGITSIYRPIKEYQKIDSLFAIAADSSTNLIQRMRRSVYLLSFVGEAEAIGQAIGKVQKSDISKQDLNDLSHIDSFSGGPLHKRVELYYTKLKRKVQTAIEYGLVLEEKAVELEQRVRKAFPKLTVYKRPPKDLRSLREADVPQWLQDARDAYERDFGQSQNQTIPLTGDEPDEPKTDMTVGMIPEDEWEAMVSDYKSEYLPENAFSRSAVDYTDVDGVRKYDWELEQELTTDFVDTVRSGQSDAANENGITDMLWIAVSHKTLCDHCEWRDGLTSTEIEEKLDTEHSDDDIDAIVPPAHINCFCRVAPVTNELLDATPDDSKSKEFDEWLTT